VVGGPEDAAVSSLVEATYGFMTSITNLLGAIGGVLEGEKMAGGDCGIVITISS
jgi:hypothetical protein